MKGTSADCSLTNNETQPSRSSCWCRLILRAIYPSKSFCFLLMSTDKPWTISDGIYLSARVAELAPKDRLARFPDLASLIAQLGNGCTCDKALEEIATWTAEVELAIAAANPQVVDSAITWCSNCRAEVFPPYGDRPGLVALVFKPNECPIDISEVYPDKYPGAVSLGSASPECWYPKQKTMPPAYPLPRSEDPGDLFFTPA